MERAGEAGTGAASPLGVVTSISWFLCVLAYSILFLSIFKPGSLCPFLELVIY
jgi:hypothetical protein